MRSWLLLAAAAIATAAFVMLRRGKGADEADWVAARRDDLLLGVEVTGVLKAVDSSLLGPPQISEIWSYKISQLAPEGTDVKKGTPVIGFDTSELERKLEQKIAESESASKQMEKKQVDAELKRREDDLRLAEAQARERKAAMKVDRPADLASASDLKQARLDLSLARDEIGYLDERETAAKASDAAELEALRNQRDRAAQRVREIREAITSMSVTAPRDGTVIYSTDWREEKKKVGDNCWRGEKVLEIPDLRRMTANGEVDEADAGRIAEGQKVTLRLDAHPDVEFTGRISTISKTVQAQSYRNPLKVVRLDITLDRTDTVRMRPGMRFRGTVETGRVARAVVIPLEAVFPTAAGPVAYRRTLLGFEAVPLRLGKRNDRDVEVLEGLREGDLVARRDLEKRGAA